MRCGSKSSQTQAASLAVFKSTGIRRVGQTPEGRTRAAWMSCAETGNLVAVGAPGISSSKAVSRAAEYRFLNESSGLTPFRLPGILESA